MEYREIVAVTGLGGLYQLLTTKSDGAIVRNVADKTTKFISARQHNVTPLESIEVYTTGDNVRLHHVFRKMQENEATITPVDARSNDANIIKAYFTGIFPEFDHERVYVSDMKKMLKWYEVLKANDLLHFEKQLEEEAADSEAADSEVVAEEAKAEETAVPAAEATAEVTEEKPAKKAKAKKADETEVSDGEEKPKKTAKKKKADDDGAAVEGEEKAPRKAAPKKKKSEE